MKVRGQKGERITEVDFAFENLTSGQEYNIYFAAGSDTFKTEQLWTDLYTHIRTTTSGISKLAFRIGILIGLILVFLLSY